jgi:hypothetical protein
MTGDTNDMLARIKAVLPARWFPDATPLLDGVTSGLAEAGCWLHALLANVQLQTRVATATGGFLDMIAQDYFGSRLPRRTGQSDSRFRVRIQTELFRERGTRGALVEVLEYLTGRTPAVFEPARPADTRAWGVALGYGVAGGWGSLMLPFQCFVTAYRPTQPGDDPVSDDDIMAAIAGVTPVAAIAWVRISN